MTKKEWEVIEKIKQSNDQQDKTLDTQNKRLDEILMLLKGSDAMNFEGMISAQKRMERTLERIEAWEVEIKLYMGILTSKRLWRILFVFLAMSTAIFIGIKYGWDVVWRFMKGLFSV